MREHWVEAEHLREPRGGEDFWAVDTAAHPLLDPAFPEHPSRLRRFLRGFYERIRRDDEAYRRAVAAQIHPPTAVAWPRSCRRPTPTSARS
jgi:hypothetical protein